VRVPTADEIAAIEAAFPGVVIQVDVREGMRLSELCWQDSYTYEVATVFIGATDNAALEHTYQEVMQRLPLEFAPVDKEAAPCR